MHQQTSTGMPRVHSSATNSGASFVPGERPTSTRSGGSREAAASASSRPAPRGSDRRPLLSAAAPTRADGGMFVYQEDKPRPTRSLSSSIAMAQALPTA